MKRGGYAGLLETNKKEVQVKARKALEGRIEDDTWAGYIEVYGKLLCFIDGMQG